MGELRVAGSAKSDPARKIDRQYLNIKQYNTHLRNLDVGASQDGSNLKLGEYLDSRRLCGVVIM